MLSTSYIKGVMYAVVSSVTFGLMPLFSIPLLDYGLTPQVLLCYRFIFATVMMICVVILTNRDIKLRLRQLFVIGVLSVLYTLTSILLLESYVVMPSGIATTIHFLYPLLVALIMMWVFEERSTHSVYIAIAISLCGVTLLAWGGSGGDDFYKGVALAAVTVITYALYVVGVMKSSVRNIDPVVLTLYTLGISTILIIIYTITTTGVEPIRSFVAWRDILMLALVSTVVSNYTLVLAIKNIGSTMTSILSSMEPMTAIFIGVLYFDERLGVLSVAGVVLIILAVIIVVVQGRRGNL